jgi:integrase
MTFRECAEAYIAAHQTGWRSARHGAQWHVSLGRHVYPIIGKLDVAAITVPDVLRVLEQPVEEERGHPAGQFSQVRAVSANRVRNRIELILAWATARGHRKGENPARWRKHLDQILMKPTKVAPVEHFAAVPYAEVPALLTALRQYEGVAAQALQFAILTATRTDEVRGAVWNEFDLTNKVWIIPPERMKGKREHRVPLSDAALNVLNSAYTEDGNPHVFIGGSQPKLSHAAINLTLKRLGRSETVHGFRSSFSDWAHDRTAFSNHVIELSLAHSIGSAVEKSYRRTNLFEKRRKLMEQWAVYCTTPSVAGEVVPLRVSQ